MRQQWVRAVGICLFLSAACQARGGSVSYDAASGVLPGGSINSFDGTSPLNPNPFGFTAPAAVANGILSVGPTDPSKYTFYFVSSLTLDHTKNVEIDATLKLDSQTSSKPADRAGLAIGLTDDRNLYQEIYIGDGEIFLNKFGRVRDVSASVDTTTFHDYRVKLNGDDVTVSVDNVVTLHGKLFDASGFGLPTLANWAVVGDITSDANSSYELKSFGVSVTGPTAAVPLPSSGWSGLLALGVLGTILKNTRRQASLKQNSPGCT